MNDDLFKLLFLIFAIVMVSVFIFSHKAGKHILKMQFKQGRLVSHKGKIPEKFERDMRTLAKKEKLTCIIHANYQKHQVRLQVSADVTDNNIQRIRNLFPFEYFDKRYQDSTKKRG